MHSNGDNGQWQIQVSGQCPASKEQVAIFFPLKPQNCLRVQGDTVRLGSSCSIPVAILAMGNAAGF